MSGGNHDGEHVTHRELSLVLERLDERLSASERLVSEQFRSQFNKIMLVIGVAVGIIRFDIPKEATAAAFLMVVAKFLWAAVHRG